MSLSKIIQEIAKVTPFAEENVEGGPTETLANRRGRKIQSKERLKQLRKEYVSEVLKKVVFIVVTGSEKEKFLMLANEKQAGFNADPEEFFDSLVDKVAPVLYEGKESNASLFEVVGRHLEDKAMDLDIIGYPQLLFKQQYRRLIRDREEFQALIKRALNEQVGSELIGIQAIVSIVDQAIADQYTGNIVPIILATDDESLITSLSKDLKRLTANVFTVVSGKTSKTVRLLPNLISVKSVDEEKLLEVLTSIKKLVKVK